MSELMNIVIPT